MLEWLAKLFIGEEFSNLKYTVPILILIELSALGVAVWIVAHFVHKYW